MNITFLIGNGFDLGIGLNTGYENFYDEYSKIQATDNTNILSFKTMLDNRNMLEESKIIDWSDFEKAFGQHSADFVNWNLLLGCVSTFLYCSYFRI